MTSYPDFLTLIDDRSTALRAAVDDLDARVPGCPAWTVRDLVGHVGQGQSFWARVVAAGPADGPPPRPPVPGGDLLEWSASSTEALLSALRDAGPDAPCWTWWPSARAAHTTTAVARNQVGEVGVHAWDAQDAIGKTEPLPAAVALDGVEEFLQVAYGAEGSWPDLSARVDFAADEGRSWVLDLSELGARLDPREPGGPADATVRGPASEILLALRRRTPLSDLQIDGDTALVERLRAWGDRD